MILDAYFRVFVAVRPLQPLRSKWPVNARAKFQIIEDDKTWLGGWWFLVVREVISFVWAGVGSIEQLSLTRYNDNSKANLNIQYSMVNHDDANADREFKILFF